MKFWVIFFIYGISRRVCRLWQDLGEQKFKSGFRNFAARWRCLVGWVSRLVHILSMVVPFDWPGMAEVVRCEITVVQFRAEMGRLGFWDVSHFETKASLKFLETNIPCNLSGFTVNAPKVPLAGNWGINFSGSSFTELLAEQENVRLIDFLRV